MGIIRIGAFVESGDISVGKVTKGESDQLPGREAAAGDLWGEGS